MAIKKNDFESLKKKFSTSAKYKPQRFFDLGGDFLDAVGLPGPAIGHLNMFLGHSDTGKTTALVKTAVDAQKKGILPVFIITEQKWSFEHAKLMGFQCEEIVDEETGELDWDGFYIFNNNFDYIEQITDYINTLLDAQEKGELDYSLLFLWDSVGSVPCKMTFEGKGGKQHNARSVKFATRTKVSVLKNHINGLGYEDGKIIVTPHGFLAGKEAAEEKTSIEAYKKEYADYWKDIIGSDGDFTLKEEKED